MNRDIDSIPSELQDQFLSQLLSEGPLDFSPDDEAAIAADAEVTIDPRAALANDPMLDLRDSPMIEDRFQALLKDHFLAKAEQNLPVFPWESTELQDYPDTVAEAAGASANPWLAQVQNLRAAVPEDVFEQLLEECQTLAQGTLQVGRQMLEAVDSLFPGESQALNAYAGRLMPALEGGFRDDGVRAALPSIDYEAAQDQQKMVLALVTAHDLLRQLELNFSQAERVIERQWLTSEGLLELRAEWQPQADALVVAVDLPCGGRADLVGSHTSTQESCNSAGTVDVLLPILPGETDYTLSILLATEANPAPLTFALHIDA